MSDAETIRRLDVALGIGVAIGVGFLFFTIFPIFGPWTPFVVPAAIALVGYQLTRSRPTAPFGLGAIIGAVVLVVWFIAVIAR